MNPGDLDVTRDRLRELLVLITCWRLEMLQSGQRGNFISLSRAAESFAIAESNGISNKGLASSRWNCSARYRLYSASRRKRLSALRPRAHARAVRQHPA